MSSTVTLAPPTCFERSVSRSRMLKAVPVGLCGASGSVIAWTRPAFQSATNSTFPGPTARRDIDLISAAETFTAAPRQQAIAMTRRRRMGNPLVRRWRNRGVARSPFDLDARRANANMVGGYRSRKLIGSRLAARLGRRLTEPVLEPDRADARVLPGCERPIGEEAPEIARVDVWHDLARIPPCPQEAPDQFVERHGLRASDFDRAVNRRCDRDIGERRCHVLRRDRLDQRRRQADLLADGGRLGNATDKLEELRGTQDGVGNAGRLDQAFLRDLRPEIAIVGKPFATNERQGNMVAHAGSSFRSQQVTARCLEKLEDCLVFPYRRVGHIDDDFGAVERFGQTLAGDGVYARVGGGWEHIMAAVAEVLHKFRSDEAGASDDDDLHGFVPFLSTAAVDVHRACLCAPGKSLQSP